MMLFGLLNTLSKIRLAVNVKIVEAGYDNLKNEVEVAKT